MCAVWFSPISKKMMASPKPLKQKKCRSCKEAFTPWNSLQVCCTPSCAIEYTKSKQITAINRDIRTAEKIKRKKHRQAKESIKTRSDWLKEAQTACNAYIRKRDGKECISCGTRKPDIQYAAGHYKSRGACPELRFHPFNVNSQCNHTCNMHLSGNIENYRPELIKKIGENNVLWLESKHPAQNWTIDDIKEIKQYYKEQLSILIGEI